LKNQQGFDKEKVQQRGHSKVLSITRLPKIKKTARF